jgi:predicted nuclease of restriction endonuclease-like (RecB) superfamily
MEMIRLEHWDTRTLDDKMDKMLYERTALSRKPEEIIRQELSQIQTTNTLTPDTVFRSNYFLNALGLSDVYS